jgi:hypothetical protein
MNLLVCSKVSIPSRDRTLPGWEYLRSLGHQVVVKHPDQVVPGERPDVIISMGVSVMAETFEAADRWPHVPLFCYNWDCYEYVWTNPRPGEYDFRRYGELLKRAAEVWVPSHCTGRRTTQWWGLTNWWVILSACPWWDPEEVADDGYALCTLRVIPDPWVRVFEECCAEAGVPYLRTDHNLSLADYRRVVSRCRFLVNHYHEASTGGLTLLEGYYMGKPVLNSDSEWNGAADYFAGREGVRTFRAGDREDFKRQLLGMRDDPPRVPADARDWVTEHFSDRRMVDDMMRRVYAHTR